jgi:hypothetical protein
MPRESFEPTFGDPVEREGLFLMDPIAGSKRLQACTIRFDDGEEWILSYRANPEYYQYIDKRVRVKGRPYWPSPNVQHVMGTHLQVDLLELAEGETPYDPLPTEMPAPPIIRDGAAFDARVGRWVQCVGTLLSLEPEPDGPYWSRGVLRMEDGAEVTMMGIPSTKEEWRALRGERVTVLGRVYEGDSGKLELGTRAVCPGEVPRCGMDSGPPL